MEKLKDYLNPELDDFRRKQVTFFKETSTISSIGNTILDIDYKIYTECLEVYINTGVNYYNEYMLLKYVIQIYKLQDGIRNKNNKYFHAPCFETYEDYKKSLSDSIELYNFFDIVECCDIHISVFEDLLINAEVDWNFYKNNKFYEVNKNNDEYIKKLNKNYLNFDEFNEVKLQELYLEYKDNTKPSNRYTVKELMNMNIEIYNGNICLLIGFLEDKIQFVGKTTRIFNYIYNKNKEFKIDNVAIFVVDEKYIDDLYVELIIRGEIESNSNIINYKCMKYVSYNKAKSYYKSVYKLTAWDLKRIIKKYNIDILEISGGTKIISKIKLHRAVEKEFK